MFDASWYLPADSRQEEYVQSHVTGARFCDLNEFHDPSTTLPNMLLRDEQAIAEKLGALGITNDHKIIFYDNSNLHTSCRAVWMMKVFGHNPNLLYVVDGGFTAWEKYGGKVEAGEPRTVSAKKYTVNYEAHFVRALVQIKNNLHHPLEQIVDLRHPVRYAGGKEQRPGIRSGHIPNSFCFPYTTLFEADGRFKSLEKIRKQLTGIGLELTAPIVSMCGSGMTAAILNFALDLMQQEPNALYDGSWTEWGAEELYHGETSLAERPVVSSLDEPEPELDRWLSVFASPTNFSLPSSSG